MTIADVAAHFTALPEDRSGRFEEMAGAVFAFQRASNPIYSRYCNAISTDFAGTITLPYGGSPAVLPPFLPVDAFKHGSVTSFKPDEAEAVFLSSATGSGRRSRHYVRELATYEKAVSAAFDRALGEGRLRILAHLPDYADESSLVYMLRHLIAERGVDGSGFFLDEIDALQGAVASSRRDGIPLVVFGAAFGLLDLVATHRFSLPGGSFVVETGGMKTHRREMARGQLHERLAEGFDVPRKQVRSEYGMCELMSQCYTDGAETFTSPPWVRCFVVDPADPSREMPDGDPGALAVIDLANLYSCSFLLTGDRAVRHGDGFDVTGRLTDAELRGCNFLLDNV